MIEWKNVIKKEIMGFDDTEFDEVHEVRRGKVITESGVVDKELNAIGIMT